MIKLGTYIARPKGGDLIPCSDAAGEIEEVGDRVTSFKKVPASGKGSKGDIDDREIWFVRSLIKDIYMVI
jgi:hypothetical protein